MITTRNGVLFEDGIMLNAIDADRIANSRGFQFAEHLVEYLERKNALKRTFQLKRFQTTLEQAWNQAQCVLHDHEIRDCSHAGPDSGDMDHECTRCGRHWAVPLY